MTCTKALGRGRPVKPRARRPLSGTLLASPGRAQSRLRSVPRWPFRVFSTAGLHVCFSRTHSLSSWDGGDLPGEEKEGI